MERFENDFIITCSQCGLDFDEADVNIIDYDLDLCINCENKFLQSKKDLKTKKIVWTGLIVLLLTFWTTLLFIIF